MLKFDDYDVLVIGGGFFGCILAAEMALAGRRVVLCEKNTQFLQRASHANQARIHNGYHYPRSALTALRSRVNFPRFVEEFRECVVSDFEQIYAVPRRFSKVAARQFRSFMERIGAPIWTADPKFSRLFDPALIEEVFSVVEYAFDAEVLCRLSVRRMEEAGVEFHTTAHVRTVAAHPKGIAVTVEHDGGESIITAREVFNCTYSQINEILDASGLPTVHLKHELTEMALIEPPEELANVGVTVMCGPFFSVMPFPPRKLHTLSHVRYTPHCSWQDGQVPYRNAHEWFSRIKKKTKFAHMIRDASRYVPALAQAVRRDSLWEVKTILPRSEIDDSRPILFRRDQGLRGLICVMGGKIDNIYDALAERGLRAIAIS